MKKKYIVLSIFLLVLAPYLFSFGQTLITGQYERKTQGARSEWVPGPGDPLGEVIKAIAAISVWIAVPLQIYNLLASPEKKKIGVIFSIAVLCCGFILFQWREILSFWLSGFFPYNFNEDYLMFWGIIGMVAASASLVIDIGIYRKLISQFLMDSSLVKSADVRLKKTEFHIIGYEEKSRLLVRKTKSLKSVFRVFTVTVLIICFYLIFQNISYFINISSSIEMSSIGTVSGLITLIQNAFTIYIVIIIPITVALVFIINIISQIKKPDIELIEAEKDEFVNLVKEIAFEMGLTCPKIMYSSEVSILKTIKHKGHSWILAHPILVNVFLENYPTELKAAILHEFFHILNGDIDDKTRMYNVHTSIKLGTKRLMGVLGPIAIAFPFSLVLLTSPPPIPFFPIQYLPIITGPPGALLIFLILVKMLEEGIHPFHIAPFLVSLFVGVLFLPFAIFWGKLDSLIQKRADLEAADYLQSKEQMILLLNRLESAVMLDPKNIIDEKGKQIGIILENKNWKEHIFSIPCIILDGIYEYSQRFYSSIDSRIDNLLSDEEIQYTKTTKVKRLILSVFGFFSDIPKNKGSQSFLVLGLYFSPVIFVMHYFPNQGNLTITVIYTIISIIVLSKIGKYVNKFFLLIAK